MKIFSANYLKQLISDAERNPRFRQHANIHESYKDSCQRLFNAIEPESYIRPHCHASVQKDELLIAIRGRMVLISFNNRGSIIKALDFGSEKFDDVASGAEVASGDWHIIALEPGSVLLEVKAGPFDPRQQKDLAPWAPAEDSFEASSYINMLKCEAQISK